MIGFSGVPLGKYNMPLHVNTARQLGFKVFQTVLPEDVTAETLGNLIDQQSTDENTDAILLLQPLPPNLNPLVMGARKLKGFTRSIWLAQ
jgi:5,10-methylene-tetrahydrofolate dehydrogenase/methenyl tetrahydrofolate cyclohydrolase